MEFQSVFQKVQEQSRFLLELADEKTNEILTDLADLAISQTDSLLKENQKDLDRMERGNPKYDRLKLTSQRIKDIASDLVNVSQLPAPQHQLLEEKELDNGLVLKKTSVPLGVIGVIYEARPNVTFDVFSLCLKSGNACILKGGSDAHFSNTAIIGLIHQTLEKHGVPVEIGTLLPPDRQATHALLNAVGFVDIIIPRGSQNLIDFVRENARVPVIETGAGIVHTYVDESADIDKATAIIENAKTRRVSVCNALDCLIIHENRLEDLAEIVTPLAKHEVVIYADEHSISQLNGLYPEGLLKAANASHYGTEFLSYKMAIKTVGSAKEAIGHISRHSSKHSEAIIAEDEQVQQQFLTLVDAAAVYANTSTAFTDGAQFGLGAEIGISTQKLHARGPMALGELTSYKWVVQGTGQIRN